MSFVNTLAWWQWLILGIVPLAIIVLYFLKLRRQPVEVPSTYLWSAALEDLHVNSLWQRLRQNILLFLQLLLILLLLLALLRPGRKGSELAGERLILLLDVSASMQATDVRPSRLEEAKRRALQIIDSLQAGQSAMVLTTSNQSRVEQPYTMNRPLLRRAIQNLRPTYRTSDLEEALRYADGLANPGRSAAEKERDVPVAEPMPATIILLSDGGFARVPSFFLGNLDVKYFPIGEQAPDNVAILAFSVERNTENPSQVQAYGRLENFGPAPVQLDVSLYLNGQLTDVQRVTIPSEAVQNVEFELSSLTSGYLELRLERPDQFDVDNHAYVAINPPRRARVLLATPGNEPLELALTTTEAQKVAEVQRVEPAYLDTEEYRRKADEGAYDLVIYDRCAPQTLPAANTLFIGTLPPGGLWSASGSDVPPQIIDWDRAHPLMQLVEMSEVRIAASKSVTFPSGGRSLLDADIGPLMAIAPRGAFEDVVLGFEILQTVEGRTEVNTNWPIRRSYPVFFMNVLRYLGTGQAALALPSVQPGQVVTLYSSSPTDTLFVTNPQGEVTQVNRETTGQFLFINTELPGIYEVRETRDGPVLQRFPVNLFDRRESDIRPEPQVRLEHETIQSETRSQVARREYWRWLVVGAILVLVFEWYVYNRRIYL